MDKKILNNIVISLIINNFIVILMCLWIGHLIVNKPVKEFYEKTQQEATKDSIRDNIMIDQLNILIDSINISQ